MNLFLLTELEELSPRGTNLRPLIVVDSVKPEQEIFLMSMHIKYHYQQLDKNDWYMHWERRFWLDDLRGAGGMAIGALRLQWIYLLPTIIQQILKRDGSRNDFYIGIEESLGKRRNQRIRKY